MKLKKISLLIVTSILLGNYVAPIRLASGTAALAGVVPASAVGAIIGVIFAIGSGLVWYNNTAGRDIIIGCIGQFPHAKSHWITAQ